MVNEKSVKSRSLRGEQKKKWTVGLPVIGDGGEEERVKEDLTMVAEVDGARDGFSRGQRKVEEAWCIGAMHWRWSVPQT